MNSWTIPAVQVWIDPDYPDAHRDPKLRAWLAEMGKQDYVALIRYDHKETLTLIPPNMTHDGQWHEHRGKAEWNRQF